MCLCLCLSAIKSANFGSVMQAEEQFMSTRGSGRILFATKNPEESVSLLETLSRVVAGRVVVREPIEHNDE